MFIESYVISGVIGFIGCLILQAIFKGVLHVLRSFRNRVFKRAIRSNVRLIKELEKAHEELQIVKDLLERGEEDDVRKDRGLVRSWGSEV